MVPCDNQGILFRAIKGLLKGKDKITFPRHDEVTPVNCELTWQSVC